MRRSGFANFQTEEGEITKKAMTDSLGRNLKRS
jgi:hypothetical protein